MTEDTLGQGGHSEGPGMRMGRRYYTIDSINSVIISLRRLEGIERL
jgi:hypothetical protein